jgi:hypothetical protein
VSGRDIDGLDSFPGTINISHRFSAQEKGHVVSSMQVQRGVRSAQALLGAPHRWDVQKEAQVRGQTKLPGMCNALTVAQKHVGRVLQLMIGRQKRRDLPKGKQSGDIWERNGRDNMSGFQRFQTGPPEGEHHCHELVCVGNVTDISRSQNFEVFGERP